MDQFPIMIAVAFVLGLGVRFVGLPPLVGFLLAGFGLNLAGYASTPDLETAADVGVTILLFSIGLKLRVGTLLRPAVWGGATAHMTISVLLFGLLLLALPFGAFGTLDIGTAALVAFALSFSSTVFAVTFVLSAIFFHVLPLRCSVAPASSPAALPATSCAPAYDCTANADRSRISKLPVSGGGNAPGGGAVS